MRFPRSFPTTVKLTKPRDLRWSEVEIVAFVQSAVSLEVVGAADVALRAQP